MSDTFGSMPVEQDNTIQRVIRPLDESRGWMKLMAIMMYIAGGMYAITIIGLVVAWLPIWMGYLLWKSAASAEAARATGSEADAVDSLSRLKTLFTIQGVLIAISLVMMALMFVFIFITAIVAGSS